MLQENGGTDSLSCTRTAVRWERKQERSFLSSWFLYEILSFRISRMEVLNLGDIAQRNCMIFATFPDTLMISQSRVESSSNIWPLKLKRILCLKRHHWSPGEAAPYPKRTGTSQEIFCRPLCFVCVYINCQGFVFHWVTSRSSVFLYAAIETLTFPFVSLYSTYRPVCANSTVPYYRVLLC